MVDFKGGVGLIFLMIFFLLYLFKYIRYNWLKLIVISLFSYKVVPVINQCYSLLTRVAITRRFASLLALLMAGDPSEGAVQLSSNSRNLVVCSDF